MLPLKNRLKKRKEFAYIYKNGKKVHSSNLTLIWVSSKKPENKIGISVSNKVGNAVIRNKIKRQLRDIIRKQLNILRIHQNFVLVAHPSIRECDFSQISAAYLQLLQKGKLLNE